MNFLYNTRAYEAWAPVVARVLFAVPFLVGAYFKLPGSAMSAAEVAQTAAAGVPLASAAVMLAFILEVAAGIALIIGWQTRAWAFVLALYVLLLAAIFYHDFSNLMVFGMFVSHLS